MYLHLFLLIVAGVSADSIESGRCNREKKTWPWVRELSAQLHPVLDRAVAKIAIQTIKAETYMRNFCNSHADHNMRETYGMDHYKLSLSVDDFDEDTISVKVMHKLVYVRAEDCSSTYADVRILPEVVDVTKGKWTYALGELTVFFPYISTSKEPMKKSCENYVNTNVIVVPKHDEGMDIEPDIDIRFGDVDQKDMLKEYLVKRV